MISKQEPIKSEGDGRPFEMNPREPISKTNAERQKPIVIHLGDLNGDGRMPKNFIRKAGRCLPSFNRYWTSDEIYEEQEEAFDIQ